MTSATATKRDVYWCFGVTIVVSVLAIVIAVGRTQQIADAQLRQKDSQVAQHDADQRQRETDQLHINAALALAQQESNYEDCIRGNRNSGKLLSYIDGQVIRQRAATNATLASAASSAEQKQTAYRNLVGAVFQQLQLHAALKPDACVKPRAP